MLIFIDHAKPPLGMPYQGSNIQVPPSYLEEHERGTWIVDPSTGLHPFAYLNPWKVIYLYIMYSFYLLIYTRFC